MVRSMVRLLFPLALSVLVFATGSGQPANAQNLTFPTPSKTLCAGDPVLTALTTCNATTTPAAFSPVFYAVTLTPNVNGLFTLLETLPTGFTLTGTSCVVTAGSGAGQTLPLGASTAGGVTKLGAINLQAGQTVICFIRGYFTNPGMGIVNLVAVGDGSGQNPVSNPAQVNGVVSPSLVLPSNLSITKTASPNSVDVSLGPQTVTYTIVITNNGPQPVDIGAIGQVSDIISTASNSVPMQVQLLPATVQCTSTLNTACLDPTPVSANTAWTEAVTTPHALATWQFPAFGSSAAGSIPVGGTITLTYQVQVQRDPALLCAKGGEALHNSAFLSFDKIPGLTITDANPADNTAAAAPDVTVQTGQNLDPDCGLPIPGPISITKKQITPNPIAWGAPVTYRIKVKNSDANPIVVRLRDRVMEWAGTPPFDATVVNWSCVQAAACTTPAPSVSLVHLAAYYNAATAWDKLQVTVPGAGGAVELDVTFKYARTSCDSFAAGDNIIRNIGRADYAFGNPSANFISEADVDTIMQASPSCHFEAMKKIVDVDPDKLQFGEQVPYIVTYHNAETTPATTVGTLFDAVRIVQPNYANQLPFQYSYSCSVTAGSISGPVPTTGSGTGNIVHTSYPSQGVRIIQNTGPLQFGPNATLTCQVTITVSRPAPGDSNCLSSEDPRIENLALMDVSTFYNPSLPWPPSQTYSPTLPSQPPLSANWHTVSMKAPKCYRAVINKSVSPNFTWAPGGPSPLNYTIELTNSGDTLTGSMGGSGWNGLHMNDAFYSGFTMPPVLNGFNMTSSCSNPAATWVPWNGVLDFWSLISNFPRPAGGVPCKIDVHFSVAGPYTPGQICNRATAAMSPNPGTGTDTPDWYANDPNPALLSAQVCVPVLPTNTLLVKKDVDNETGAALPGHTNYPMTVTCVTPNPTPGATPPYVTTTHAIHGDPQAVQQVNDIPVGSTCTVDEQWSQLPVPGPGACKPPATPVWQVPIYGPAQSVLMPAAPTEPVIAVVNTLKCVTPPVNSLTVTKTFQPPSVVSQLPPDAVFPVKVVCTPSPTAVLNLIAPNFQQMLTSLPVGTSCQITEQTPQGTKIPPYCKWVQTTPGGDTIVIPAQGNPTLSVNNALICNPPVDLAVTKTGPTPDPAMPGSYVFTITVTSPGGPFTAPPGALTVTDTGYNMVGSPYGMTASPSNAWNCATASPSCVYTGPGPTVAGQVLGTFTVHYRPFTPSPYVNCATVSLTPSLGVVDSNPDNDNACVTGGTRMPHIDLQITKTGPVAVPGSHGLAAFTLTVTNPGAPFTMPAGGIVVQDIATGLPGSFTNVGWNPGNVWSCSTSGATGNCTYTGSGLIATGQVLGTITLTYHPTLLNAFTNCATVAVAPGVQLEDIYPPNNKSCVTVSDVKRVVGPPIDPTIIAPPPPPPLRCDPSTTTADGKGCACRYESMAHRSETDCACPAGKNLVAGKGCVRPIECHAPMVAIPGKTGCACPEGTVQHGHECVKPIVCHAPLVANPGGTACACPTGTILRGRECVKPIQCTAPMIANPAGTACACPSGTVQRGRECVKSVQCIPPMVVNPAGTGCACPQGTVQRGTECVKIAQCTAPMVANPAGPGCVCPTGWIAEGGTCVQRRQPSFPLGPHGPGGDRQGRMPGAGGGNGPQNPTTRPGQSSPPASSQPGKPTPQP